jgi:hypothetical protein
MYGLYSGNKSNFSLSSNLYKPAGVVNTTNSSIIINGVVTSNPTVSYTSVVQPIMSINSVQQINNNSFSAQHINYEQNPAPIKLN